MNISYNWLKELLGFEIAVEELEQILTSLGLEVEGMEPYESIRGGLDGIVAGKVLTCDKHPNADKLVITTVDIGDGESYPIVCGAPNVAAGQTVLVATVGSTLYSPEGEARKIKKAKIRGMESQGMICAEDELGLSESHDGIMVLEDSLTAGTPAAEVFKVEKDVVYEIGLTPNRSDATHHLGVARDLKAALKVRFERDLEIQLPEKAVLPIAETHPSIEVEIADSKACPRYSGLVVRNIQIGPSPDWIKSRLESLDVRSINNLVDITNLILHEMGQPLHAFDLDKIGSDKIVVDFLREGTSFTTLDEVERKLRADDLMICNGNREPMCIGGVFGGLGSGVTESTTDIFLESAHFEAGHIRRTSTWHQLRTDAAKVFEKGSDPSITVDALQRAAFLLTTYCAAEIDGPVIDYYPKVVGEQEILLIDEYLARLSGYPFAPETVAGICKAMDMKVARVNGGWKVTVPTDKADVTRPADLVEEILRIFGYDNIPMGDKLGVTLIASHYPENYHIKEVASTSLNGMGFSQMMNLSLDQSEHYPDKQNNWVGVNNTSNSHLDIMRPDMLSNALEAIRFNLNRQEHSLKLFEFGYTYRSVQHDFEEDAHLTLFLTGDLRPESWLVNTKEADYHDLKGATEALLMRLGMDHLVFESLSDNNYEYASSIGYTDKVIGKLGKLNHSICKRFDVEQDVFVADLNWDVITAHCKRFDIKYKPITRFPRVRRDLALVVERSVTYEAIRKIVLQSTGKILASLNLFDQYQNEDQLGKGKKSYAISLVFEAKDQTLTDKEIDRMTDRVVRKLGTELGAILR